MTVMPEHTIAFAEAIRCAWPGVKTYVYVSDYLRKSDMAELLEFIDGVQYTLHASTILEDMDRFYGFQNMARLFQRSHRLYIHPRIAFTPIVIKPGCWTRIEMTPWQEPGKCRLPDNEDLYIWRS